jgi:hypothetical protein
LSSNDRSRWANVRSLVEHGTYAIDEIQSQANWDTIDMVMHKDRSGVPHLYSSKPPLLATLVGAEYWLIHRLTGMTLGSHPYELGRVMLITINVIPMMIMFVFLGRIVERFGTMDWGRIFVMAVATGGTFLVTFATVFNNHVIAAVSAAVALDAVLRIWQGGERNLMLFAVAGLFAAFTAACELPAVAFLGIVTLVVLWQAPKETLLAFIPAALLVTAAFFVTNYIAHNSLKPPYMQRQWYDYSFTRGGKERPSYWRNPSGIDRGEPSRATYALHVLVGHHGIFSLTPAWLLSVAGAAIWCSNSKRRQPIRGDDPAQLRYLALGVLAVSIACLTFYLAMPQSSRNYGGMTSGFRWAFWLAPLWLLVMLPAADACAHRAWSRSMALVLLGLSVLSASYPTWNPWTHPWLTNFLLYLGWIRF